MFSEIHSHVSWLFAQSVRYYPDLTMMVLQINVIIDHQLKPLSRYYIDLTKVVLQINVIIDHELKPLSLPHVDLFLGENVFQALMILYIFMLCPPRDNIYVFKAKITVANTSHEWGSSSHVASDIYERHKLSPDLLHQHTSYQHTS